MQEIRIQLFEKDSFLQKYSENQFSGEACKLCPCYGTYWSCPPGMPDTACYLERYSRIALVMLKVSYTKEQRKQAEGSAEETQRVREQYYETAKKRLLCSLLELEKQIPDSKAIGAGKCSLCRTCARAEGKPCRHPEQRRYSITGFGLNFTEILQHEFQTTLLWVKEGLPEYDVAIAALMIP